MKIALVTNSLYPNGEPEYVRLSDGLKRGYCSKWGIDYVRTSDNHHPAQHPVWSKLQCMLRALEDHDWAVWMDCDAAPVGLGFDLAGYLATVGDKVVMQRDINGFNAGVFAVPRMPESMRWLRYIESLYNDPRYQRGWREQQAMMDSFAGSWAGAVQEPPRSIGWNSYLQIYNRSGDPNLYVPGHWTLHMPAVKDDARAAILSGFAAGGDVVYAFATHPHIGDNVICTAAVRNVRLAHPSIRFLLPEVNGELWDNNRDVLRAPQPIVVNMGKITYGTLEEEKHAANGNVVEAYTRSLCMMLGIDQVPAAVRTPVLELSDEEKERSRQWNGKWLLNANCQTCSMSKGYPHWQRVVDALLDRGFELVQVGGKESRDLSPELRGVTDMRGKTTIRELVVAVYGCDGVIGPPSCTSNMAAAFAKPQVIVNASREPDGLLDYPNAIHVSHRHRCGWGVFTGCITCSVALPRGRTCSHPVPGNGRMWCSCQWETPPEAVVDAVLRAAALRDARDA